MSKSPYRLTWKTVTNSTKKIAVTHFNVKYEIGKVSNGNWNAWVTVPGHSGVGPQSAVLVSSVSFTEARKACQDDATRNGGR